MSTVAHPRITPEELLKLPDGDQFELVDGQLVETHWSGRAAVTAGLLLRNMGQFVYPRRLGYYFSSGLAYRCFPNDPDRVRHPDASFIASGRLSEAQFKADYCPIAPDLAVEVLSPHDVFSLVEAKVSEYLDAGVRLVWVLDPMRQVIHLFRPDGSTARLSVSDDLSGEDVLPGFTCPVLTLFLDPTQLGFLAKSNASKG